MTGPHRITDREVPLAITGYFMQTRGGSTPVLIGMPGTDDLFMFVFSTEELLAAAMSAFGIVYESVAFVTNGGELLDEIRARNDSGTRPYRLRLAVDPHQADNGRVHFIEPLVPTSQEAQEAQEAQEVIAKSALATMQHADDCQVVRENGVAVWMCIGTCPAMAEFIRSGQVDDQPWDQLDRDQCETVVEVVHKHALKSLVVRDEDGSR